MIKIFLQFGQLGGITLLTKLLFSFINFIIQQSFGIFKLIFIFKPIFSTSYTLQICVLLYLHNRHLIQKKNTNKFAIPCIFSAYKSYNSMTKKHPTHLVPGIHSQLLHIQVTITIMISTHKIMSKSKLQPPHPQLLLLLHPHPSMIKCLLS